MYQDFGYLAPLLLSQMIPHLGSGTVPIAEAITLTKSPEARQTIHLANLMTMISTGTAGSVGSGGKKNGRKSIGSGV